MPRRKILPYHPYLKEYARKLRNGCTPAEAWLWPHLRGKQMEGFDFHRQKPLDNYIIDFYCCELLLAIELDGGIHDLPHIRKNDEKKAEKLATYGITMIRFSNNEIFMQEEKVLQKIKDTINEIVARHAPKLPGLIY